MINYICGVVDYVDEGCLVLDQNGIGFQIFVPGSVMDRQPRIGDEVKIYTYLHVKEDALQLYGFMTRDDLEVFRMLIGVNGVGPKAAIGILSGLSANDLKFAVLSDDTTAITKAPGIGKKTAQKLILELKDKFSLDETFEQKYSDTEKLNTSSEIPDAAKDAVQALVSLGYSNTEAFQAVNKVRTQEGLDAESMIKAALKVII